MNSQSNRTTLYFAVPEFEEDLKKEFSLRQSHQKILQEWPMGMWVEGEPLKLAWAQSTWHDPVKMTYPSIGGAIKLLQPLAERWTGTSAKAHRRQQLILDGLRSFPNQWRNFRENLNHEKWGGFFLLDESTLLYSMDLFPKLPVDDFPFVEDKTAPSRAYGKLWESFYRTGVYPQPGETCFELGASPGGWTHVLRELGAEVWANDRAELAPALMKDPKVHFLKGDGFQYRPDKLACRMDWVVSDVICYPDKLWDWVQPWLALPKPPKMICTLKFQAETDFATQFKFAAVPGSQVVHLFQNKHEVTWLYLPIVAKS